MSSTVPLSVKCVPKRSVSDNMAPHEPVAAVTLEVKPLVISCALSSENLKPGVADVVPESPDLREIFVTTTMVLLATIAVALSVVLTIEMSGMGTDMVTFKASRKRLVLAAVKSALVKYLYTFPQGYI